MVELDVGCSSLCIIHYSYKIWLFFFNSVGRFHCHYAGYVVIDYVILHRHFEGFFSKGEIEKALKQLDDTG
jgi:hypothetical protein